MNNLFSLLIAAALLISGVAKAQLPWMPDEAKLNAARGMLARMDQLEVGVDGSDTDKLAGALHAVTGMATRIDNWGLENIISEMPVAATLSTPEMPHPIVQAIANYGVCGVSLHPELVEDEEEKLFMVAAEFSVFIISGYLRAQYIDDGGTDEALKTHLTSESMESFSRAIQTSQEQLSANLEKCQPFFLKVIGSADA
ncbi:MAG: hypothetical protein AB8B96_01030 [Lysobacterales bacterium]